MTGSRGGVLLILCLASSGGCGSVADKPAVDASNNPMIDAGNPIDTPAIDAAIDADLSVKFDVGYINDITVTVNNNEVLGFAVVVNKGVMPLAIQTATVVSYVDDTPALDWKFTIDQPAQLATLAPGHAAGRLSPLAASKIVDTGLVPEPIDDGFLIFDMIFSASPPAGTTFNAQAVLLIDGKKITLPFLVHIIDTGNITANSAKRASSQP